MPGQCCSASSPDLVASHVMFHVSSCSNGQTESLKIRSICNIIIIMKYNGSVYTGGGGGVC